MRYTNTAALSNVPTNTKDLESQHTMPPQQNEQKNRGWNFKKGAIALVCAATAGITLRELAIQHHNNPHHTSRILTPDTESSSLSNSTAANATCPDGYFQFDKASQLKRAKIAAIVGMGVLPGLAIASFIAMSGPFSDHNNECMERMAGLAMCTMVTSLSVAIFTIPLAALMLARAKSTEDGACTEYIDPVYTGRI